MPSYNGNNKRYKRGYHKDYCNIKYQEGDWRYNRRKVKQAIDHYDPNNEDDDIIIDKWSPAAISSWLS